MKLLTNPVTVRAVVARINRKLLKDCAQLRKARGERAQIDLGDWYVIDLYRNVILGHHVDPAAYAEKLGVLAAWERVVEKE